MTSISAPTCNGCDRLTTRSIPQARRPRITTATGKDGRPALRPSLRAIRTRFHGVFSTRASGNLPDRRAPSDNDNADNKTRLLAQAFGHPHGAGFIGPGADALLRAMLTEALTCKAGVTQVITTRADLDRLFSGTSAESVISGHAPRLRVTGSLEDAIEHLELEAELATMVSATSEPSIEVPAIVWFATPGPDADVVHEPLRCWPDSSLFALMSGPWPYGPTHLIEETGPRPLPCGPIPLLSAQQTITRLSNTH